MNKIWKISQEFKMQGKIIGVEISPVCNLRCPDCATGARLHVSSEERRDDSDLVRKIIEYAPLNANLYFLGLGEPAMPKSQGRIVEVLSQRKDLTSVLRTNGTYPLSPDSVGLVNSGRLEIELSTDQHHLNGGQRDFRIQSEYVSGIETSVKEGDKSADYRKTFQRLNRLLVTPLLKIDGMKILPSWRFIEDMCCEFQKVLGEEIFVYSELPFIYEETNQEYFRQAKATLVPTPHDGWMKSKKHGFYVQVEPQNTLRYARFLIDGTFLTADNLKDVTKSWQEVDKHSKPIENLPKVFDSEARNILSNKILSNKKSYGNLFK